MSVNAWGLGRMRPTACEFRAALGENATTGHPIRFLELDRDKLLSAQNKPLLHSTYCRAFAKDYAVDQN